jgi:hypothetical protein
MRKLVIAAILVLACSAEPPSPEDAVRETLAAIESAAGERDAGAIGEHVSEAYRDARGNDKRAVLALATLHLMRNQAVYTLSRVASLELVTPDRAEARVYAALAGQPIPDPAALLTLRADLYRFDVVLREEQPGVWRVDSASWRPATLADFQ